MIYVELPQLSGVEIRYVGDGVCAEDEHFSWKIAKENDKEAKQKSREYHPGQEVVHTNLQDKLSPQWQGPYSVTLMTMSSR